MSFQRELARKLLHVSTAVVPVAYAADWLSRPVVASGLAVLLAVALAVELARRTTTGATAFARATGTLLREHEHAGAWAGATWLLLAFLVATLAFPRAIAVMAMLGVSLGDAAGAVVGRWWGTRRRARAPLAHQRSNAPEPTPAALVSGAPRQQDAAVARADHHQASAPMVGIAPAAKTWVGTVACAVATALGALLVARAGVGESVLAGVLAAAAERPVWRFDDNLRIVLAVGAGILLCRLAFS